MENINPAEYTGNKPESLEAKTNAFNKSDESNMNKTETETKQNVKNILSDIENSEKIKKTIESNNENACFQTDMPVSSTINETADVLKNINSIKDELCKLPLDPCENNYISNYINPLLSVLNLLSSTSVNLATSVYYLTNSPVVHPKKSELEDTIHLIYNINEECEDVYKIVKRRLNVVINNKNK